MTKAKEDAMEQRLRWMEENVNGAYNAKHPEGHSSAGKHCTNSGTCIIVCCYINGLGKVLLKGGPPRGTASRDFPRFQEFLKQCMNDFISQSTTMSLPPTPRGRSGGDGWLYEIYRCGFVHGYPGPIAAWGRFSPPRFKKYLYHRNGGLFLNIDALVRGFYRGIEEFRRLAASDDDLRTRFMEYIIAD